MMTRRIFAGSIVALLLSVSPLAAACDLSCAFARADSDCHSQKVETQDPASGDMKMDGRTMDGMAMPEMAQNKDLLAMSTISRAKANHPSIGDMGPCEKQSCDSNSAVSANTSRFFDSQLHAIPAVIETPRAGETLKLVHDARDDIATSHVRGGSSLHLTLRI
jgi:hypothetical protein